MGLKFKLSAVVSLVAVTALSIQGLAPAAAAEPDDAAEPTPAAATVPADESAPATAAPEAVVEPAEPVEPVEPAEPEAPKLLDLTIGHKASPIRLNALKLPLNLGSLDLNPQATTDATFGGGASGVTAEINVAGLVKLKSTQLGAIGMKPGGGITERSASILQLPALPIPLPLPDLNILSGNARGVVTRTVGSNGTRPVAQASVDVARLDSNVYFAYVGAKAVSANARAERLANGEYKMSGGATFGSVEIAGLPFGTNPIAPNTVHDVAGLGRVVLNEQKVTQVAGEHGIEVHAIHITLDTAQFGLPIGADIYIGSAEAIIYE